MQRLSDAIQTFHDEIVNLKSGMDALHKALTEKDEPMSTNWAADILSALDLRQKEMTERLEGLAAKVVSIEFSSEEMNHFTKEADHEFHTRLKMLERDIRGYEAGLGLNLEVKLLQERLRFLEEKFR